MHEPACVGWLSSSHGKYGQACVHTSRCVMCVHRGPSMCDGCTRVHTTPCTPRHVHHAMHTTCLRHAVVEGRECVVALRPQANVHGHVGGVRHRHRWVVGLAWHRPAQPSSGSGRREWQAERGLWVRCGECGAGCGREREREAARAEREGVRRGRWRGLDGQRVWKGAARGAGRVPARRS